MEIKNFEKLLWIIFLMLFLFFIILICLPEKVLVNLNSITDLIVGLIVGTLALLGALYVYFQELSDSSQGVKERQTVKLSAVLSELQENMRIIWETVEHNIKNKKKWKDTLSEKGYDCIELLGMNVEKIKKINEIKNKKLIKKYSVESTGLPMSYYFLEEFSMNSRYSTRETVNFAVRMKKTILVLNENFKKNDYRILWHMISFCAYAKNFLDSIDLNKYNNVSYSKYEFLTKLDQFWNHKKIIEESDPGLFINIEWCKK